MSPSYKSKIPNKRIDEAFEKAEPWAQPILHRIRELIHQVDGGINENWKWGPNFEKNGMICGLWAFKKHISIVFYKGALMKDPYKVLVHGGNNLLIRIMKYHPGDQIDEELILAYIREAIQINESGIELPKTRKVLEIPDELKDFFEKDKDSKTFFEQLAYTYQKEYIVWINSAKRIETRIKRVNQAIEMIKQRVKYR